VTLVGVAGGGSLVAAVAFSAQQHRIVRTHSTVANDMHRLLPTKSGQPLPPKYQEIVINPY